MKLKLKVDNIVTIIKTLFWSLPAQPNIMSADASDANTELHSDHKMSPVIIIAIDSFHNIDVEDSIQFAIYIYAVR